MIQRLLEAQHQAGWLSDETLRAVAGELGLPLHRVESVASFYTHFRRKPPSAHCVRICRDLACQLADRGHGAALREALRDRGDVEVVETSCLGRCEDAPVVSLDEAPARADVEGISAALAGDANAMIRLGREKVWEADPYDSEPERYGSLREALNGAPAALPELLSDAGLRGMGGAGFPTGRKWQFVAAERRTPKFVVCNADESEPGTFKDRQILSDLPHLVIEGMALAGFAVGANRGILFIRHEYDLERERFEVALAAARQRGALGPGVFGSDFDFDIEVFVSPGGYILGEESALLECIEGRRGEPRNKPPFPGSVGLYGLPTLINNVETFAHATAIALRGADWWRGLGREGFAGHKFISVSGDVQDPGVVLVPMGTTLAELLERCGGMRDGMELAAIAPGGASSNFLTPDRLETPLDFDALAEAGSMLGSGAAIFVGEGHSLLAAGTNVAAFFRNESCGKCVPCRVGTEKALKILDGRERLDPAEEGLIRELDATLRRTSICGLGQVALAPLVSILDRFPETTGSSSES